MAAKHCLYAALEDGVHERCLYLLELGWEPNPVGRSQESHPGVNSLHIKGSCGQELGFCTVLLT